MRERLHSIWAIGSLTSMYCTPTGRDIIQGKPQATGHNENSRVSSSYCLAYSLKGYVKHLIPCQADCLSNTTTTVNLTLGTTPNLYGRLVHAIRHLVKVNGNLVRNLTLRVNQN
jgi:hypothetical protein